jgi:hypothetical protein
VSNEQVALFAAVQMAISGQVPPSRVQRLAEQYLEWLKDAGGTG